MKKVSKKKTTKKSNKLPNKQQSRKAKMLTKKEIENAISAAIKPHNDKVEAHNKIADKHNYNLSYLDPNRMDRMDEISENDPLQLFDSYSDFEGDFGDFEFECVEDFGGEGQGDHCHQVYKVTQKSTGKTAHIKYDGYYSSHDGSSYDDEFYVVEPYDKIVKAWRKVK